MSAASVSSGANGAGAELLHVMSPSQILPNHVIALRRWKVQNEKVIAERIRRNLRAKKEASQQCKAVEFKRSKKIPLDELTKDWLGHKGATDELRVYLIENCLPSVVLGLESLLVEIGKCKNQDRFNSLNYLGQHLMRNNPRYNNHIGKTPYMKGLNEVKEELRKMVSQLRLNESAQITSEARRRRYARQARDAILPEERERRSAILAQTFDSWAFGEETIPLYKIQRAMRSFMEEKVPRFNEEMRAVCRYVKNVSHDDLKESVGVNGYVSYIMEHIEGWPIGAFQAFIQHIDLCAKAVPIGDQRQRIQSSLTSLFRAIDKEHTESLDRGHILGLIKEFYGSMPVNMKKYINNPLDWSDKDTVYSPTPTTSLLCTTSQSIPLEIAKSSPEPPPPVPEMQVEQEEDEEEEGLTIDGDAEEQLKHDIELIGAVHPSPMSQARPVEIDPRINIDQFLFVTEKLLGEDPHPRALTALSEFLEDSFQETPQQRQIRQLDEKLASKKHSMLIKINDLFDEWDADKLGFIDKTEILAVLSQWQKNSTKSYNIEMSKQICSRVEAVDEKDVLRDSFLNLCLSFHSLLDSDDYMDRLLDFVQLVVQTQRGDLRRERKRRRWLEVMTLLPKISGSDHSLYFRSFFDILEKDMAHHGAGRLLNAYIALVEKDPDAEEEEEDKTLLRYVASTTNDHNILVGRTLYANQKCISNQVRRSGKAVYISQIRNNNQVHLWAMDRWAVDEDRDGAFLVLPLKSDSDKVVGVVGVDTLLSPFPTQFLPHEVSFLQNVVKQLSNGFSFIDARHKFQRTLVSLMETIPRKESTVLTCTCYVVEPVPHVPSGPKEPDTPEEWVLRPILVLNPKTGCVDSLAGSQRAIIRRSDSSFRYSEHSSLEHANMSGKRDYLFECLERREDIQNRAYGTDHLALAIIGRDKEPLFVMDLDTGKDKTNILKPMQVRSIKSLFTKMVAVFYELLEEYSSDEKKYENSWEEPLPDDLRFALRFEKRVLEDLKKKMSSMDVNALSEIKSYNEPPPIIATVIQVIMLMLGICGESELQEWTKIKSNINGDLIKRLAKFDPLSKDQQIDIHKVNDRLKGLTASEVKKGGSMPTFLLYQWIIDVISVLRVGESR